MAGRGGSLRLPRAGDAGIRGRARLRLHPLRAGRLGRLLRPPHSVALRGDLDRLEIALLPDYDNAQAGYGFLELGSYFPPTTSCHLPSTSTSSPTRSGISSFLGSRRARLRYDESEYFGFHEAAADLVALIASAHFDCVLDPLLEQTAGNLYVLNRLNRIGETVGQQADPDGEQRCAPVDVRGRLDRRARPLAAARPARSSTSSWTSFTSCSSARRLISPEVEHLADVVEQRPEYEPANPSPVRRDVRANPDGFKGALLDARDQLGLYLAQA